MVMPAVRHNEIEISRQCHGTVAILSYCSNNQLGHRLRNHSRIAKYTKNSNKAVFMNIKFHKSLLEFMKSILMITDGKSAVLRINTATTTRYEVRLLL